MKPQVIVIASTKFYGIPEGTPLGTQDLGSDIARLAEFAGRSCYKSVGKGRSSEDYHQNIRESGHGSVVEHGSISFYVTGVSRGLTHELVRHRHGSYSQQSTRYVDESESEWAWHPLIETFCPVGLRMEIDKLVNDARRIYRGLVSEITVGLSEKGVDRVVARKQARGAARGVLGNALSTSLVFSVNIRALRNFLELRASEHADAEIRLLANAIYESALEIVPELLADYRKVECPDGIGYALETDHRKI